MKPNYDFSTATRGAVVPPTGKTRITLYLDDEVIAHFRVLAEAAGQGYQTLLNTALRQAMAPEQAPVTVATLRQVLREERR